MRLLKLEDDGRIGLRCLKRTEYFLTPILGEDQNMKSHTLTWFMALETTRKAYKNYSSMVVKAQAYYLHYFCVDSCCIILICPRQ